MVVLMQKELEIIFKKYSGALTQDDPIGRIFAIVSLFTLAIF
jgi:hypothetical protein